MQMKRKDGDRFLSKKLLLHSFFIKLFVNSNQDTNSLRRFGIYILIFKVAKVKSSASALFLHICLGKI